MVAADIGDDEAVFAHMSDEDESESGESEQSGENADADDDHDMEENSNDELEGGVALEVEEDDAEDDDAENMLSGANSAGGTAAQIDIPPAHLNQTDETPSEAPNIEHGSVSANTSVIAHPEDSQVLHEMLTDPFSFAFLSAEPESRSTVNRPQTRQSPPPATQCLKLRSNNPPTLLSMVYMPHSGQVMEEPEDTLHLARFLKRQTEYNNNTAGYVSGLGRFAERYHMLRMYEKDVEMRTLDKPRQRGLPELGILCPYALTLGLTPGRAMSQYFRATSRLNMVIHIPELFLVVIGSPIGRVLLVTPTRLAQPIEKLPGVLHHGLRIEWILPRQSDELALRENKRPLHGMAIGPVQDEDGVKGTGDERQRVAVPRRYRLMLHYRNHDILTYEISREEQTGKLCIF